MSTSPLLSDFGILYSISGTGFPVAYADPTAIVNIANLTGSTAWVKVVTDAASNFTGINVQLVDSYRGAAGSWVANSVVAVATDGSGTPPTITGNTAVVVTVTAAKTYWVKLQTANTLMGIGGASVVVWASGGAAKSGDGVTVYLVAAEGV